MAAEEEKGLEQFKEEAFWAWRAQRARLDSRIDIIFVSGERPGPAKSG